MANKSGYESVQVNTTDNITPQQVQALRKSLKKHYQHFSDKLGLANEPEKDWLHIPLLPGTEKELKPQRQYRLGPKEKKCVDEVFDKQRRQGRLVDSHGSPVGWPVFVVKKGSKWRPVVDLRGLNKLIAPDAYPLPRQDEIEPVYALNVGSVAVTLLQLDDEFKKIIIAGYDDDIFFRPIYKAIKEYDYAY